MLTSRAWFSSSRSCEPEFGMRSAVRVVNERTRGVAKSLWQVLADRYLPTSNCGQVPALAQVLAHVLVQVFARALVLADKHLCSRKYLHTYLHKYLREHKYLPTRVCGQVLVLAQVLAQLLPQVLVRPDAAARSILPSSANRSRIQHRVQRAASAARRPRRLDRPHRLRRLNFYERQAKRSGYRTWRLGNCAGLIFGRQTGVIRNRETSVAAVVRSCAEKQ
jgi:hypothetical protein